MQNKLKVFIAAASLGWSAAQAQPPAPPQPAQPAPAAARPEAAHLKASDALTRLEAETLVLKAREKQLGVQASIIAKQNEIAAKQGETERMVRTAVTGNPVVQSVEGIGRAMVASLELDNGTLVDVRHGDVLANGMKVVAIQTNGVVVEKGRRRIRLTSAATVPAPFNPGYPGSGLSLPTQMPMPMQAPAQLARGLEK